MTITIPAWLLWLIGGGIAVTLIACVGFLAIVGWQMRKVFSK